VGAVREAQARQRAASSNDRPGLLRSQRGQAVVELALQIPVMIVLLFGAVQIGRVFYTYHTLQTALRGGAGLLARATNVQYCDVEDPTLISARNLIVFGNLQGEGTPVVPGLTPDMIQILPERRVADSTTVTSCLCTADDPDSCDATTGGRAPDYIVVNLSGGFPLPLTFPYMDLGSVTLNVSVRMPVTGG
ncbi:MAG: pilus assembly protein, partial [Acidobacteria bacterium]|nr:pilus assembly protein [Acidobacteriota bacterium]